MALFGDDRLPESMQEFRIYGGADHIIAAKMTTSLESIGMKHRIGIGENTVQGKLQGFTKYT